ncbi:carbohydrate-responsive element-binding protein-like isoform X2 [Watersipora subatra]|uniref:carbohydrate-responsive element-binding protein-like isoform X2 n=1 Tax=Watersipora subatra TaxID=2589382 RepID=UPI00355B98CD
MVGGTVGFPRRVSALSGHFPACSLREETQTTNGMNSLDPVTYPCVKPSSRSARALPHDQDAIDHTFQRLFACMSLAYNKSAKMEAPQFKAYKGLRISVKEKMRLNNIVWREWYLQFGKAQVNRKRAKICDFSGKMEHQHIKPTCVVLEGKYWKRSNEVVKNEYMKWRVFFKERMQQWNPDYDRQVPDIELLDRVGRDGQDTINTFVQNQRIRAHYSPPEISRDEYHMDLSDDLFNTLQSSGFPYQTNRDLLHLESSDLMQPELIGLEPDLYFSEQYAAEPLQELLADVMQMDTRFSTGQKRPVLAESQFLSNMALPPAYPAVKRSRSNNLQLSASATNSCTDPLVDNTIDNFHPTAFTPSPQFDLPPVTSMPLQTQNTILRQNTYSPQVPAQGDYSGTAVSTHTSRLSDVNYQRANSVTSSLDYSCGSTCVTSGNNSYNMSDCSHNLISSSQIHSAQSYPVDSSYANSFTVNSGVLNHTGGGYATTSLTTAGGIQQTSLASDTLHSSGGLPSPTDQGEFKKPEAKIAKPGNDTKSSFLTKLLGKPLDKESQEPASLASTPIHPVYFPAFTPITYTPHVKASPNQGTIISSGKDNGSSASAEEDRREAPSAERKRRIQIKTGFDALSSLVPTIATNTSTKTSKATMLTKTLEFIEKLQAEEKAMHDEMQMLTNEIAALNSSIAQCHGQLPATGIPMVSQHKEHMKSILRSYITEQASKNWKFYVFSKLMEPLFDPFYNMVSTASVDDMHRSTQAWLDQYCSLSSLRPALSGSLREMCTETSILTDPSKFPEQAREVLAQSCRLTPQTRNASTSSPPSDTSGEADNPILTPPTTYLPTSSSYALQPSHGPSFSHMDSLGTISSYVAPTS